MLKSVEPDFLWVVLTHYELLSAYISGKQGKRRIKVERGGSDDEKKRMAKK